jgi:hypothetical protein
MPGQRTEHVACFYTVVTHVLLSDWFILFPCFFSPLPILSSASPFSFPHPALNTFPFSGSPTCFLLFVFSFVYFRLVLAFSFSFLLPHLHLNLWTSSDFSLSLLYFLLSARSSFFFPPTLRHNSLPSSSPPSPLCGYFGCCKQNTHFLRFQILAVTTVRLKYIGMWHRVVWYTSTNFSGGKKRCIYLQDVCSLLPWSCHHQVPPKRWYIRAAYTTSPPRTF